ncbi:hypothetical protein SynPROSU1_01128 [Synechococcus sp. PROS-U-1]|nr:hypothetical protein SynPROSU1_01128 [Synechococcus sp. PROS-U-1]
MYCTLTPLSAGLLTLNRVSLTAISPKAPIGRGQRKPANDSTP